MVVRQLGAAAIVAVLLLILGTLLLVPLRRRYHARCGAQSRFPYGAYFALLLLLGYLVILLKVTFTGRAPSYGHYANFHLFRAWWEAWNAFSQQAWLNVLLNVAMFAPFGALLALFGKPLRHWYTLTAAGLVLSLCVELGQYATGVGLFDVDDLFCNTLGALLGGECMLALLAVLKKRPHRPRRVCGHLALPLCFLLGLGCIFAAYARQEYGNFPQAPAYRVPLSEVIWAGEEELSDSPVRAAVYRAGSLTRSEADDFAETFFGRLGQESRRIWSGEDTLFYEPTVGAGSLSVDLPDGSWQYITFSAPGEISPELPREALEQVLSRYGVTVPPQAELSRQEDGAYLFTLHAGAAEEGIYDGVILLRLDETGEVTELNQLMPCYKEESTVSVRSPREAFRDVQRGWFTGPEWHPGNEPESYVVTGCRLDYLLDTKGYYRPVFRFDAQVDGSALGEGLLVLP